MDEITIPVFQYGEKVRHRTSGELAVISKTYSYCAKHQPIELCGLKSDRSDCDVRQSQYYDISIGFGNEIEKIDAILLERVDE